MEEVRSRSRRDLQPRVSLGLPGSKTVRRLRDMMRGGDRHGFHLAVNHVVRLLSSRPSAVILAVHRRCACRTETNCCSKKRRSPNRTTSEVLFVDELDDVEASAEAEVAEVP